MERKRLVKIIQYYLMYKRAVRFGSFEETSKQLEKVSKYGCKRALLEHELNCWAFIKNVDSIVLSLPKTEREFALSVLSINTKGNIKSAHIAKEMGISAYQLDKQINRLVKVWPKKEEG